MEYRILHDAGNQSIFPHASPLGLLAKGNGHLLILLRTCMVEPTFLEMDRHVDGPEPSIHPSLRSDLAF